MQTIYCPANQISLGGGALPDGWRRGPETIVEHSGLRFSTCVWAGSSPVWPIEEYLARRKHKKSVCDRIARLNPLGKPEGSIVRGLHPKFAPRHTFMYGDLVPVREYEKKWGCKPKTISFKRGRHKFVTQHDFVSGPRNGD